MSLIISLLHIGQQILYLSHCDAARILVHVFVCIIPSQKFAKLRIEFGIKNDLSHFLSSCTLIRSTNSCQVSSETPLFCAILNALRTTSFCITYSNRSALMVFLDFAARSYIIQRSSSESSKSSASLGRRLSDICRRPFSISHIYTCDMPRASAIHLAEMSLCKRFCTRKFPKSVRISFHSLSLCCYSIILEKLSPRNVTLCISRG